MLSVQAKIVISFHVPPDIHPSTSDWDSALVVVSLPLIFSHSLTKDFLRGQWQQITKCSVIHLPDLCRSGSLSHSLHLKTFIIWVSPLLSSALLLLFFLSWVLICNRAQPLLIPNVPLCFKALILPWTSSSSYFSCFWKNLSFFKVTSVSYLPYLYFKPTVTFLIQNHSTLLCFIHPSSKRGGQTHQAESWLMRLKEGMGVCFLAERGQMKPFFDNETQSPRKVELLL